MASTKQTLSIAALGFLAFVCHATTRSDAVGDRATTHAITVNSNGENTARQSDFDGDGTVGFGDFVKFAAKFGLSQGDDGYDARYDLNGDGGIGLADFVIFAENFGKEVPADDRAVLVALYKATDGPNWTISTNWLSDKPLREWYGVGTDANGRVTRLELYAIRTSSGDTVGIGSSGIPVGNGLSGEIPVELGRLSNLTLLSLEGNQLTGTIPPELGQLSNLTYLSLGRNQLTGTIPSELLNLSRLESLALGDNQLTGTIPSELLNLSRLESLALGDNQLTGTIPPELGQLSNLTYLGLGRNQLTGTIPSELLNLSRLESLALGDNQLTGTIPPELGKLTRLWQLWLPRCGLKGKIPPELGQLTKLEYLTLEGNQLTGMIPSELGNLSKLVELWLGYNQLTGTIPPELGQLDGLTRLDLTGNANLSGPIPKSFTRLGLDFLYLSGTAVCMPLISEFEDWLLIVPDKHGISHCANPERDALIALYTQTNGPHWTNKKNWLTLAPLGEWYGVTTDADGRVTQLNLRDNNLSGFLPLSLSSLANLKTLNLADNAALSGPLPLGLTRLPLESLDLEGTRLCAPPRAEFQTWLNGIRDTDVARCTDTRPDFYALVALYSGTDGRNWTEATNWASTKPLGEWYGVTTDASGRVTGLSLHENSLQGTIPAELAQLTNLASLNLSGNQLTDNIPAELAQLTNLASLNLPGNQLTGAIPSELGRLNNLKSL